MRRVKCAGPLVLLLFLLMLSGCSVRPADGTYLLPSGPSSSDAADTFDLKEVRVQPLAGKKLLGWRGDYLILYDSTGVYQFDYNTASVTPLLTLEDRYINVAALSGDGKKIAYSEMDRKKEPLALYVSDSDCRTGRVDLSGAIGGAWKMFAWSGGGRYLYSRVKQDGAASVYDMSTGTSIPVTFKTTPFATIYDVEDASGELLLSQFPDGATALYTAAFDTLRGTVQTLVSDKGGVQASFAGHDDVAVLSGNTLNLTHVGQADQKQTVSNVARYGISADKAYICLIKTNSLGYSDVYAAHLRDGAIADQTLIYRGFEATAVDIFFSPDDRKIAVYGSSKGSYSSQGGTVAVLSF